jgi:TonB family protein
MGWAIPTAETFCNGMLLHLWQTTLVLLALYLLSRALRDAPAALLAGLWWIGVAKLFLPLSLLAPVTSRLLGPIADGGAAEPATSSGVWVSVTFWLYPTALQTPPEPAATSGALHAVLTFGWIAALGWILTRRLRRSRARATVRLPSDASGRDRLETRLGDALNRTAIPRSAVVLVEGAGMPAVRGLLRPRIELPCRALLGLETRDLTAVLVHENEHRLRRDPLRSLPGALASWLFFFYPPVRWLVRSIHETTEMACDEAVLRFGIAPRDYLRSIAQTLELGLEPEHGLAALGGPSRSTMCRRVARLRSERRYRTMPKHRWTLAAAALIVVMGSIAPLTPGAPDRDETKPGALTALSFDRFAALDRLASRDQILTLNFEECAIESILNVLPKVAPLELELHGSLPKAPVTIVVENVTLREALIELAELAHLTYTVPDPDTLQVSGILMPGVDGVTAPQRLEGSAIQPVYPESMRKGRIEGQVVLQAVIETSGRTTDIEILRVTPAGNVELAEAAIEAVEQWRYEPATLDGKPVAVYFTVVVKFALTEKVPPAPTPDDV